MPHRIRIWKERAPNRAGQFGFAEGFLVQGEREEGVHVPLRLYLRAQSYTCRLLSPIIANGAYAQESADRTAASVFYTIYPAPT